MLKEVQAYVQRIAEVISEVIGLDVTIVDKNSIRIAGTGSFANQIGKRSPIGSAINIVRRGVREYRYSNLAKKIPVKNVKCSTTVNRVPG